MSVRVPAKVNLQLSVGPPRDDGYHDLVNVFHAVSLFDEVTATPAPGLSVVVEADGGLDIDAVPVGPDNLAARAATLVAARIDVEPAVQITIRKAIPVAGGMAGGSADAAAALVACNELWDAGLGEADLHALAADLGSDVPFALLGGTAVGLGRGERLSPVPTGGRFDWVFALADGGLSTAAVYAECDRLRAAGGEPVPAPQVSEGLIAALAAGNATILGRELSNDLQPAALTLRSSLDAALAAGRESGALGALVSGSGPTCAFLAESEEHAVDLAAALADRAVARSVIRAHGPVPGATVL
ncbi:MAG TPA: 4-(cytidine 5'-diphospho)-2-C-methyl-D-erythritol kinase [Streptosporangiaceae bacterium]|nr:4-(cytidine 5'-diphospho)-2-C-methyl-D-erythritol kinase [Streptosporangiaceae bacterium]